MRVHGFFPTIRKHIKHALSSDDKLKWFTIHEAKASCHIFALRTVQAQCEVYRDPAGWPVLRHFFNYQSKCFMPLLDGVDSQVLDLLSGLMSSDKLRAALKLLEADGSDDLKSLVGPHLYMQDLVYMYWFIISTTAENHTRSWKLYPSSRKPR